jgi:hypothetical protein
MELHEQVDAVCDERTLLDFIGALVADLKDEVMKEAYSPSSPHGPGLNGWENDKIEDFLEAASRWAASTEFGKMQGLSGNPWRQFAAFLYCGKIYE